MLNAKSHLLLAIKYNNAEQVALCIKQVDLAEIIENEMTSIQLAAQLRHWKCVEAIASNRNTDAQDNARYGSALLEAVCTGELETAKILLNAGSSRNWRFDGTGDRCLHTAVRQNNPKMIALLLSFDFDLAEQNNANQTPVQLADSLRTDSLKSGWELYCNSTPFILKKILPPINQASRQPNLALYQIFSKSDYLLLVLSFLIKEKPKQINKKVTTYTNFLTKTSANCLLAAYRPTFWSSSASKELVARLKTSLESDDKNDNAITQSINKSIQTYLKKHNLCKKTKMRNMLFKYHLVSEGMRKQQAGDIKKLQKCRRQ